MYAASYDVNIVKELIGRGANISLQNKKGQFLIDIIRAKRDEFEWRDELAYFVEQTEDELTSQILPMASRIFWSNLAFHQTQTTISRCDCDITTERGTCIY